MKHIILNCILYTAKHLGLFALCKYYTRNDLRILCYHGAAIKNENDFRPSLFITKKSFWNRMRFLKDKKYPVISLSSAIAGLDDGNLPDCATVITIDDGWYGTYAIMGPAIDEFGFPATVYIATYYLEKQYQVFNVAIDYVLWIGREGRISFAEIVPSGDCSYDLRKLEDRERASYVLCEYGISLETARQRQHFFRQVCELLDVDWKEIESSRLISFMNADEARELGKKGIDLQLHTHRHRFLNADFVSAKREIDDNRRVLSHLTSQKSEHFCYPSGQYSSEQIPYLRALDIVSSTTTLAGFNRPGTSKFELRRFLDSEKISQIEFEAEMSGFLEIVRRLRRRS